MKKVLICSKKDGGELFKDAAIACCFFEKLKGLMGKKDLSPDQALVLERCNWVHTFFMRTNIDLIFLDKNTIVCKLFEDVPPGRLLSPIWGAKTTLECRAGSCFEKGIKVGDQLQISSSEG